MYSTIDCGTTNMRARLFDGNEFLCETRRQAGVRNTDALVLTEASCMTLRYPKAHLRIIGE